MMAAIVAVLVVGGAFLQPAAAASTCFGDVHHGRLQGGERLAPRGPNFAAYSATGVAAGRTWVHASVAQVVLAAYRALEASAPDTVYVYGETGLAGGGQMAPHRTHQAGTSVDFMVPVRDRAGQAQRLPTSASRQYGYGWEFDASGRAGALTIDFEALGEHLYQLALAGEQRNVKVARVIFDPQLAARLFATRHGAALRALPFLRQKPWIRHDEHYHVDFAVPCRPYGEYR